MSEFEGVPFVRIGQSMRMWFKCSDIAMKLGIGKKALLGRLRESDAGPFLAVPVDIRDLRVYAKRKEEVSHESGAAPEPLFDLDFFLAGAFSLANPPCRGVREVVCDALNKLMYDGFVSLPFKTAPDLYRGICAFVCEEQDYHEIARSRFDPSDEARGTKYAPAKLTTEILTAPESYMTREEITCVRALELAFYLLLKHGVSETKVNKIIAQCGVNLCDDSKRESVSAWLVEQHDSVNRSF